MGAEDPRRDRTVIVVDDDDALLNALTFGIEVEGYRVLPFSSAEEVLDLREMPDVQCVVVDHRLPRLDGLYLIELMRARGVSAPAILMTSNPGATLRARCESLRVPIVEKPLLRDELSQAIRSAIGV
ncbi:MAG: response regulator [Hyphomonadaceae bacterium]|nr:MAG: response regulator [Caulobacteraceae bacterium]MBT9446976.1 response regulator [Hyphomonadaceae bacterium]TPW08151.1 MAG: response regulator [Alphaproteobacteria bacterium]